MYLILMLFLSAFQNVQESQMISCVRIRAQHHWRSTAIDCGNDDSSGRADFASNVLALSACFFHTQANPSDKNKF